MIALIAWSACTAVFAQSLQNGSLAGKLTDLYSAPLAGVVVTLRNKGTGAEVRTTTAKGGVYRFSDLGVGEYTLIAESQGLGREASGGSCHISGSSSSRKYGSRI